MSSFIVFSTNDYTVMSSDSLASHKTVGTTTLSTKRLTKLSVLGRGVYAVGIGDENPVFSMLSQLAVELRTIDSYGQLCDSAERLIKCSIRKYPAEDVRIVLVSTRALRHEEDINAGSATSATIIETASELKPRHIPGGNAFEFGIGFLNRMAMNLFNDQDFIDALMTNSQTAASIASALHTFAEEIGSHVGGETNLMVVGEDGHTVMSGYVKYLPAQYLRPAPGVIPVSAFE